MTLDDMTVVIDEKFLLFEGYLELGTVDGDENVGIDVGGWK